MNIEILKQLIDDSPGLVFCKDLSHRFIYANQNMVRLAGLQHVDELVGKADTELVWRIYAEKYRTDDDAAFSGKKIESIEYVTAHNGIVLKVHVSKSPLLLDNEIAGIIGFARSLSVFTKKEIANADAIVALTKRISINKTTTKKYFMGISPREAECLFYFIRGYTYQEIADKMCVSTRTVESHLISAKNRFSVNSKQELMTALIQHGFYDIIPDSIEEFHNE